MRFSHTSSVMIKTLLILGTIFVDHLHFSCGAGMFPQQLQLAPDCDNSSISSMRCPNLGNISLPSPFILDELKSCIPNVSADFVLTNCNSNSNVSAPIQQAAFWQSFTQALPPQDVQRGLIGPPAVIGLTSDAPQSANPYIHVNLTWDSSLMRPQYLPSINSGSPSFAPLACRRPHSSTNLSHYFPTSINLTKLYYAANNQVSISSNTKFLLFNCSNKILYKSTADKYDLQQRLRVVDSTSLCQLYKDSCSSNLTAMFGVVPKCYELQYGTDDTELVDSYYVDETVLSYLSLQSIIDNMSCTHSEVFVVSSSGGSDQIAGVEQWLPGVMQLLFIKPQCSFCQGYKSSECVYSASNRNNPGCNCTSKEGGQSVLLDAGSCIFSYYDCWHIGSITICGLVLKLIVIFGGIGMGALLFLVAFCCCAYRCGKRSMKNRRLKRRALWERQHAVASNGDLIDSDLIDLIGLAERPAEYSYKSIKSATRSFSSLVGKGGFGVVFKGEFPASRNNVPNQEQYLSTPKEIAVKVLDVRSHHTKKQFVNEVAIIGRVHHVNVVRLLGFCVHDEHEMLVYEYVTNGSLDRWLFEPNEVNMIVPLDWRQRYSIAVGIARGLSYLHEECRHRIIHCDVKPQNILLDGQLCPKIADFGLARLINRAESRVVTFAKGTPGYMAPELWVGGDVQLSTKADVYSFGMVLLELISGRKNFLHGLPNFPTVAFDMAINKGDFISLLDKRLTMSLSEQKQQEKPTYLIEEQIRIAVLVALWCIQDSAASRPSMSSVVQFLEGVAAVSEHPPFSTIASASEGSIQSHNSSDLSGTDVTPR